MLLIICSIFLIGLVPVLVGFSAIKVSGFSHKVTHFLVSFAGGVMLGNAFFDLLPESVGGSGIKIINVTLLGIVSFYLLEKYFLWHCHTFEAHSHKNTTFLVMAGDTLHNFIDGVVIAGSYLTSPLLGITTSLAIALHEIPQELADFSVLVSDGIKPKRAIYLNFLSGLIAVLGGITGYFFLTITTGLIPYFTAFAAGMFIYIACSDLIPKSHAGDKRSFDFKNHAIFYSGNNNDKSFYSYLALIPEITFIKNRTRAIKTSKIAIGFASVEISFLIANFISESFPYPICPF